MHIYAKVKINILRTMRCESQTQQLCGLAYNTAHAQLLTFTAMRLTTYSTLSTIEALRQLLQSYKMALSLHEKHKIWSR